MNFKQLVQDIREIVPDNILIEKYLIKCYISSKGLNIKNSNLLRSYLKGFGGIFCSQLDGFFRKYRVDLTIDIIGTIFELLTPNSEKKSEGVFFTPYSIREFIVSTLLKQYSDSNISEIKILDPSCGSGLFLLTAARLVKCRKEISMKKIIETQLYGVDISQYRVNQAKLLLALVALELDGIENIEKYNLEAVNTLDTNFQELYTNKDLRKGFDLIIGNPPYIRTKNIPEILRKSMEKWESTRSGLPDLYIPFFEVGIAALNDEGKLGYITPNTFIRGLNGRNIRNYLSTKNYYMQIIDFSDFQIFDGATSYTCITLIDKEKSGGIDYARCSNFDNLDSLEYTFVEYIQLDNKKGWILGVDTEIEKINQIENVGSKLGEKFEVRNGFATLANALYVFTPIRKDRTYYYIMYKDEEFPIEKSVCIDVVKPNIISDELDMEGKIEKLLYPYKRNDENKPMIIEESEFSNKYPKAYKYLKAIKEELLKRDKGHGKYPVWYAFGRTQGLSNFGTKIMFPYISNKPKFFISTDPNLLYYCGYAIFVDNSKYAKALKKILNSDIFWFYIKHKSKPYSSGYMSLAKNYVVDFGLPDLSDEDIEIIENTSDKNKLNDFIETLYFKRDRINVDLH